MKFAKAPSPTGRSDLCRGLKLVGPRGWTSLIRVHSQRKRAAYPILANPAGPEGLGQIVSVITQNGLRGPRIISHYVSE